MIYIRPWTAKVSFYTAIFRTEEELEMSLLTAEYNSFLIWRQNALPLNEASEQPHDGAIVWFFVAVGALFSAVLKDIFYHVPLYLHGENREETTFSC